MKLFACVVLAGAAVAVYGQGFSFRETNRNYDPREITSRQGPLNPRRDDPNDPYNTGGMIPSGGAIVDGGVQPDPPSPGQIPPGECLCVPYYQCKEGLINDDGEGIINPRTKDPPQVEIPLEGLTGGDNRCPGIDQVCCKEPSRGTARPIIPTCGIRNDNGINSRILSTATKGESEFGEWPWQAVVLNASSQPVFECGGALIGERYILTAGHCVQKFLKPGAPRLLVRLGAWDTSGMNTYLPHADYDVSNVVVHPQFKDGSLWNDIAILITEKPVKYEPHISPICLPVLGESFDGHDCVVTGFGKNAYRRGRYANIMKEVVVPVIENSNCETQLRQTRLGPRFKLHDGFLCAGAKEGEDSCKGDGGGPLACYRKDGRYVQAGIVSWGIDCGMANVPGVYVKITQYLDWISAATQQPLDRFQPQKEQ